MVSNLVLAAMALHLPPGETRLACRLTDGAEDANPPTELTISLFEGGRGADSATIEGPPLFSSTQGLTLFDATPDRRGGVNVRESRPAPRALRWSPRLGPDRIELTRRDSRITLEPDPAATGGWRGTYDLGEINLGHIRGAGPSGLIACNPAHAGRTGP